MTNKEIFIEAAVKKYNGQLTRKQINQLSTELNIPKQIWVLNNENRVQRGLYDISKYYNGKIEVALKNEVKVDDVVSFVPPKDSIYVKFGFFNDMLNVVKSNIFYPIFVTGLSGNGKTKMVEQVCAYAKRELIRINITAETDEDDLIGHYTLVAGETVWEDGPVIKAMERGAVLLLDEVDYATMKIACLQPILEGNPYYVKKTNRIVQPQKGFNIIATANTKGKGSEDGQFIGTNILNEAFLERFPITVEQEYPTPAIEKRILNKLSEHLKIEDSEFIEKLVQWSEIIRKTYYEGGVDEIITTRRLTHILKAFSVFNDRKRSIELCISRFDEETKFSFMDLYNKIDYDKEEEQSSENDITDEIPLME